MDGRVRDREPGVLFLVFVLIFLFLAVLVFVLVLVFLVVFLFLGGILVFVALRFLYDLFRPPASDAAEN